MRFSPLLVLTLVLGCESQPRDAEPEIVIARPLEFDPTEDYELSTWWTNGEQMVRLDQAGSYAVYPDTNRFHQPVERGRWRQSTYAVLWFEPYSVIHHEPIRIRITKIDGRLALQVPKADPMFAIAAPPRVLEDKLIGDWIGDQWRLALGENLRYSLRPPQREQTNAIALAGHDGTWSLRNSTLVLLPDAPVIPALEITVDQSQSPIQLRSPEGTWTRADRSAASEPIPPEAGG